MQRINQKKIVVFDLDKTLTASKMPLEDDMVEAIKKLLSSYLVAIISGGRFEQFRKQVLDKLNLDEEAAKRLHLFPTCGTQYYRYENGDWIRVYLEGMTDDEVKRIIAALEVVIKEEGIDKLECYGERIENRENSQVTFSAYGQKAPLEVKSKFDPDRSKRLKMRDKLLQIIPEYSIKLGGTSSIDVTKPGIDKSYGIKKIMEYLSLSMDEILFVGDELEESGNDYPVKEMGVDCIQTTSPRHTIEIIEQIVEQKIK